MRRLVLAVCVFALGSVSPRLTAQHVPAGEWRHYGGDAANRKYSPLDQIDKDNVARLQVAWRWVSPDNAIVAGNPLSRPGSYNDTPLMAGGVLYTVTSLGQVAAINPGTGQTLWTLDPGGWKDGRPGNLGFVHRGLAYWTDGKRQRLFLGTGQAYLLAIDAQTGRLDPTFGVDGKVDLMEGVARAVRSTNYAVTAAPIICRDVIVVGSSIHDGPTHKEWPRGDVSGFDVRTGKKLWTFRSIPQKGEFGHDSWADDSASYTGNTNVWTLMSADEELGYVYLPFGTPTNDFYGGHRPGANLFGESLVALEARSGRRVWHFQAVHHGVWDYDFPAAPTLVDITVDGRDIKAVAQVSKQGFTYVFDRRTGRPVWPIEERPVPQSTVPGERTSPTQPFPTKPPAFERQGITEDDLIDFTPDIKDAAREAVKPFVYGPLFTPPSEKGTIQLPGWVGGANWSGGAFDPDTGRLYVPSLTAPIVVQLVKPPDATKSNFLYRRGQLVTSVPAVDGLPFLKPPYSRVTAIDLHAGSLAWTTAVGDGPRNHPLLTKTLLFIAQGTGNLVGAAANLPVAGRPLSPRQPPEPRHFYALDKATGEVVWKTTPPLAGPMAVPMTYLHGGKQYIAMAVGAGPEAELIAFSLGGK